MQKLYNFLKEETVLFILLLLLIVLTTLMPGYITQYHTFIDWKTIVTLLALVIVSTGIKESNYLEKYAKKLLAGIHDERSLALFMAGLSAALSTVLTNDITLFIVVPLTLGMQKILKNDLAKIVIFEAIAVNAGSALTPIGNPQNIFLWNSWGIPFMTYVLEMALPAGIMAIVLAIFIILFFRPIRLSYAAGTGSIKTDKTLGIISFGLMAVFLAALQFRVSIFVFPAILFFYMIFKREILAKTDWLLILTFALMFVDFSLLAKSGIFTGYFNRAGLSGPSGVYIYSAVLSQLISNVPAAIFMSGFSTDWKAISYGVNIAGNGTIIGSLANIIAIRLLNSKSPRIWLEFHSYSIPFFLITGGMLWLTLK